MTTHSSSPSSRVSTTAAGPVRSEEGPDVDESDVCAPLGDDPQVGLTAVEMQTAEDALGRTREVCLDEPLAGERLVAPQLAEGASLVRVTLDPAVLDARQCGRPEVALVRHART